VLQRFGFLFSSPQPTPLSTNHSLSAPPSNKSVVQSGPYPELVGCLMYMMTCTRPDLVYPLSLLARYVAPGRHGKVHWDAAKRVLRYLCSTLGMGLVLGGRGPLVLTGHADASWVDDSAMQRSSHGYTFSLAMAAQELHWLTYLLTDLGELARLPPVLYVDNKAMIALCQEHRLEHRTKHIALRYFLARELQQRGQLRLAYVATRANTADVFRLRQQCLLETLSLQQHREWAVRWGSPGGGAGGTSAGGVEAPSGVYFASLGACDSVCTGAELEEALHTFLLYSGHVATLVEVAASCLCRLLTHQTLLWHHRLGHPSLPRLRGMHSRLLVSGLPRSLPSLSRLLAPPCLPCVEGRQRAVPHFSFPPTTTPLQTLHMDVWGPARITGQGGERYFLLVVDDYTPYTMVFPLQSKAEDLPILRLHSDRGGDFSSRLLEDFCGAEGITQSFTLPASPQQNGIAERRIGFVIDVSVAVCGPIRRAPAQPLAPCLPPGDQTYSAVVGRGVSLFDPPPLVGPFEVSSDTSGQAERGDPAADDTAATCRSPRLETPPVFLPRPSSPPLEPVAMDPSAAGGGDTGGADSVGAGSGGAESPTGGRELRAWAVRWGSPSGGARGARAGGTTKASGVGGAGGTGTGGVDIGGATGATGVGGTGGTSVGGTDPGVAPGGTGVAGARGVGTGGATGGTRGSPGGGAGGTGPRGAVTTGAGGAGGATTRQQPSALRHFLSLLPAVTEFPVARTTPPLLFPLPGQSQPQFLPHSSLPALAPYTAVTESLTESREHSSRPVTPICIRPCLLAGDLAYTALDGEDWRCVGVPVPFYRLFPYRSAPPPPPPLFLAPGPPPVDPLPPQGPAPSGVSQVDPLLGTAPIEVAIGSGAARGTVSGGAESEGAGSGGAEPGGAGSGGAEPGGAKPGGVEPAGVEPGGVGPGGLDSTLPSLSPRPKTLSPQQLHEWIFRRARHWSGATGATGTGNAGARGAGVTTKAGGTGGTIAAGPGGARTKGTEAARTGGVGGAGAVGAGAGGTDAGGAGDGEFGAVGNGAGGTDAGGAVAGGAGGVDPRAGGAGAMCGRDRTSFPCFSRFQLSRLLLAFLLPYNVRRLNYRSHRYSRPPRSLLLLLTLSSPAVLQSVPASPIRAPSPYTEQSGHLTERCQPTSRPVSSVRTARRVPRSRPPPVPGMHAMALRPPSAPLCVPLPPPPESSLPEVLDPESDRAHAASPTVSRLLATVVTDPSFESTAASALVAELLDFATACHVDYATTLVAASESTGPPSVGGECALGTDVLEDR
ncbi:unnamed protein product, partial [Closterium sp. NIES-54]